MQRIYSITGKVQPYNWGGYQFIPQLLNSENKEGRPYAEYWLGAHPNFPATVNTNNEALSLIDLIERHQQEVLGNRVANRFGNLPFLFKVLDVRQMLSIQVHPTIKEAKKGYEKETAAGIPVTAAQRNYKDQNHKPEQMVALSDFWLLHGFKPAAQLVTVLSAVPELAFLAPVFKKEGYRGLYQQVMTMEPATVSTLLQPLAERILPLYEKGQLQKDSEDFWAARAIQTFCKNGDYDRGLFSIYFFNLVLLKKGEGIFQPAGMPHAYLEGQNIEVMANSDNVLRGGLTDKQVAVAELMKHTDFTATVPQILTPDAEGAYSSPAEEFCLYRLEAAKPLTITTEAPEIIFVLNGKLEMHSETERLNRAQGEAAFVAANTGLTIEPDDRTEFYRVTVGRV